MDKVASSILQKCQSSLEATNTAFAELLARIEKNPKEGVVLLHELIKEVEPMDFNTVMNKFHFGVNTLTISCVLGEENLRIIQLPSTFAPEEWSYTFYEGLSRYNSSAFNQKNIVELGCGNGWITLAMALKFQPSRIIGLDINPKAILSSKLNMYLNFFDEKGDPKINSNGVPYADTITFWESDLFNGLQSFPNLKLDGIIGCIPQVLMPSEESIQSLLNENPDDGFLYSLSNYTEAQGFIEDQFGLGLIARTLEESLEYLIPGGKLILNLGGRPGEQTLRQMFTRRGYNVKKIWERTVFQAKDTEIDTLIDLENSIGHRFEFFIEKNSDQPISASTAKVVQENGLDIFHKLTVFEGTIEFHEEIRQLFNKIGQDKYIEARKSLDLSYSDVYKKEEKLQFLNYFIDALEQMDCFPYGETKGKASFRKSISDYFKSYYSLNYLEETILVSPSINTLMRNILLLFEPKRCFVPIALYEALAFNESSLVAVPPCSDELNQMILKVKPEMAVINFKEDQLFTSERIHQMVSYAKEVKTRLFFDLSEIFELSSNPQVNELFDYLIKYGLEDNVSLLCDLSKNEIYATLSCSFMVSKDVDLIQNLINLAEVTYSRTPFVTQMYYHCLINHLLQFQMQVEEGNDVFRIAEINTKSYIQPSQSVVQHFSHAAIVGGNYRIDADTIRLDYGENELAAPESLKSALLEGFTKMDFQKSDLSLENEIALLLQHRFGLPIEKGRFHQLANGVAPLFAELIALCKKQNGTLVMPMGSYGYFDAYADMIGVKKVILKTTEKDNFKINPHELVNEISGIEHPWLFLNYPIVNPTGAVYQEEDFNQIIEVLAKKGGKILLDTIFSGLSFEKEQASKCLKKVTDEVEVFILGGISKEYAAGGVRFGYLVSTQPETIQNNWNLDQPHYTITYSLKKILSQYFRKEEGIMNALAQQKKKLKQNADTLTNVLQKLGWKVITPKGGLFLVASPPEDQKHIDFTDQFFKVYNILINPPEWTGIPGYYRFVLSVREDQFTKAIQRLSKGYSPV